MKISATVLLALLPVIGTVHGFKDSAPVLMKLDNGNDMKPLNSYVTKEVALDEYMNSYTERFCSSHSDGPKLYLFHGNGLNKEAMKNSMNIQKHIQSNKESVSFIPHVLYTPQNFDSNDFISSKCGVQYVDVEDEDGWVESFENESSNNKQIVIFRFAKETNSHDSAELIDSIFDRLTILGKEMSQFIVQGLPTFSNPEIQSESIMNKASKLLGLNKREDNEIVDASDYDTIEAELKEAFKQVDEMIDDELVSIYKGDEKSPDSTYSGSSSGNSTLTVGTSDSLFDNYGFFSTGIWMAGMVSLFLVYVLLTALSWLSSLQISYKALDKPSNPQKKNQ